MSTLRRIVSRHCSRLTKKFMHDVAVCYSRTGSTYVTSTGHNDNSELSPLNGIRILDLSRVLAGPYCTMILGDLGAEVIKIEKPGTGDDTRTWGPPFCGSETAYFMSVNRNKKSVAVNIQSTEGQHLIKQLVCKCDVMIENYIPGKLDSYGLGYKQLCDIAPHLIYCSITGYGQSGPYSQRAGYDVIAAAQGGLFHITGPKDGEPCKIGVAMTDLSTGLYAYGAILSAILHRQKTGRGQHIDCNLLSTQVASLVNIASNYLNAGMEATRHGTAHQSIVPYQAFRTKDGYLMVGAGNDKQFRILCQLVDMQHLSQSEKYQTNKDRVANREELIDILGKCFIEKTTDDWLGIFEGCGIPYGPINNMKQVFSDPQVIHNDMIQDIVHPTAGTVRVAGPAVRFSESQTCLKHAPPTLGQHTFSVLNSLLGLDFDTLETLKKGGIIQ